ncbi:hypothetical protein XINFAN_01870 [Pseudogemmobacter humi]|uniref:Uncharacterized protein n=1 Tax=Pseudogemmobacter humi TaxID=2483812 RepID=A0A3P5XIB5_9RHOB|nr:hypothetical protein XINFAN_01870 [Pseudogemmobacter humi]
MHTVEIQVQPRNRRIVADVIGLVLRDAGLTGQRALPEQEPAGNALHAPFRQPRRQIAKLIGLKRRIAAARQHQIALNDSAAQRPGRQQPGAEPPPRPQPFHRVKRRHRLGDRSGRQGRVLFARLKHSAGGRIGHHIAHRAGKLRRRDQPRGIGHIAPARHLPARPRAGRALHHLAPGGQSHACEHRSQQSASGQHRPIPPLVSRFLADARGAAQMAPRHGAVKSHSPRGKRFDSSRMFRSIWLRI